MSEIIVSHEEIFREVAELPKEEEERMYKQGLQDFVAGNRNSAEANYYIAYWQNQQLGEMAVKSLVQ